jgi:hypothetical protein
MNALRPRALKFRGTVEAAGFLFDARLLGLAEARRRALAVWTQGAQVFRFDEVLLVRMPSSHQLVCDRAMGAPLVKANDVLFAAPFEADELKAIAAPPNSVVLVRGGEVVIVELYNAISEPPADWLDVESFAVVESASLGAPPAAPRLVEEKADFDARQKLDGVPAEAPELAEVLAALRSPARKADQPAQPIVNVKGWLKRLIIRLDNFFSDSQASQSVSKSGPSKKAGQSFKKQPSLAEKLSAKMRQWTARMLVVTRLSKVIGKKQAQYISRMMDMFERGDLQEALRHAIPIDGMASALSRPALSLPTARSSLSLSPHQTRARSSIYMADDLLGELRRLYRLSFERLEAQGRIEEAAFVLAELLHANEEAVAFLERHGKLRLAAEMAEARELAPGLVIRQWFVAGDQQRALMLARRTRAFADALQWLERKDKKQAEVWRLLWSAALADAGDYASAVDVIWPVNSGRNLAADWMSKAIEVGGATGARMLARKLSLLPEAFDEVKEQALALLEDESAEQATARRSFAETLKNNKRTPQTRTLARAAVRAVLRDAAHSSEAVSPQQYRQLIDFAGDSALRVDAPLLPAASHQPLAMRKSIEQLRVAASDVGTLAIHDVALLPDGRAVVALGEAGVKLLTRDGRTVAHFDQPANRLVLSDNGDRAIAMAKRGEVWRLARLDFLARRSEYWVEARIDAFANDYDGSMWFIGAGEDFYAIDATAKRFDAIWRVPETDGPTIAVARSPTGCRFLTEGFALQEWHYELPSLKLRNRDFIKLRPDDTIFPIRHSTQIAFSVEGTVADHSLYRYLEEDEANSAGSPKGLHKIAMPLTLSVNGVIRDEIQTHSNDESKTIDEYKPVPPAIFGNWVAAPVLEKGQARVLLVDVKEGKVRAEITLEKAQELAVRVQKEVLTVGDNRGRLLVMEFNSGHMIRNLRI